MSEDSLRSFWALTSDYRFDIYKIINEVAVWLKQPHIDYLFEQLTQIPPEKVGLEELQVICELGKFTKDEAFKARTTDYFWKIICDGDRFKDDLVNNCITKFCDMVKSWEMKSKHEFFRGLMINLQDNRSSIANIRLFKNLIKDQKEKITYTYGTSPSKSEDSKTDEPPMTLATSLSNLITEHDLIKILLANLKFYCEHSAAKVASGDYDVSQRKKLFILNPKYSHNDEIDERLQFLKYIASVSSDYQVSKHDLEILYSLLVTNSRVPSDQDEFLTWCKSSCEQSTTLSQILDLNEVGEFFSEKMNNG